MAFAANHLDNFEIDASLQAAPASVASFGIEAFIREGVTLGGDRIRAYANLDGVKADELAGEVDSTVTAAATVVFAQQPTPSIWMVIRKEVAESYTEALVAARQADCRFYIVTLDSRDLADIALLAQYVETQKHILIGQSGDAGWLTPSVPAAFALYGSLERTAILYHDTDGVFAAEGWGAARATFDPDVTSAPWDGRARAVAGLATSPNATQKLNLDDNKANHGLELRSAPFYVDAGVNGSGRPLHEIVSLDWFQSRLVERVADTKLTYSDRGAKIPVTVTGQQIILSIIEALLAEGVAAGHFVADQVEAVAVAITDTDRSLSRLCFQVRGQFAGSTRKFKFNLNFTRDPINTEA